MRITRNLILIALLSLTACMPSLHPLYSEEDPIFDSALLGAWEQTDGDSITFRRAGPREYEVIYNEDERPLLFEARMVRLGTALFVDLFPKGDVLSDSPYGFQLIPAHSFSRIELENGELKMRLFGSSWLEEQLALEHQRLRSGGGSVETILLTAHTRELQEFVRSYANDDRAFSDAKTYRRVY